MSKLALHPRPLEILAVSTLVLLTTRCARESSGNDASPNTSGGTSSGGRNAGSSGGALTAAGAGGTSSASGGAGSNTAGSRAGSGASSGSTPNPNGAGNGGAVGEGASGGRTSGAGAPNAGAAANSGGPSGGAGAGPSGLTGGSGFYRMERLNRGVVAVQTSGGVFVSWRMLGFEYDRMDPASVAYAVYRNGTRVASVTDSTNYLDASGTASSKYTVRLVQNGAEASDSESAAVLGDPYLRVPLEVPAGGTNPAAANTCGENAGEAYTYSANDTSAADLDGNGDYEIILKWDPSNAKDNSQAGCTGNAILDAYDFDLATGGSKRLWRIDLGRNVRAGAHYTQFIVFDFDGDGKAELAVKTAPGTRDGAGMFLRTGPAANDDDAADHRGPNGYVLKGPEYLSVFDGMTGAERTTVNFDVPRGTVSAWGDDYGNRVDRFLAAAAYLDDTGLPSLVMARGYYTRSTLTAWNFRDGALTQLWKFDSNTTPRDSANRPFTGQGAHSLSVADVDADPEQEIIYGGMTIDHDGKGKCSTGYGHGDALHVSDFIPSRAGMEAFMPTEDKQHPAYYIRDAGTCAIVFEGPVTGDDTGRGIAADVLPDNPGAEMWAAGNTGLLDAATGKRVGDEPRSQNFLVFWDADESRELEDGTAITKWNGTSLLSASGCAANNGTKNTPGLVADLFGDWREEVIWRESTNAALRVYTTTAVTRRRIYTLMHDAHYRVAIAWQNVAYNQPPHPSFHIGSGMAEPPVPNISVR